MANERHYPFVKATVIGLIEVLLLTFSLANLVHALPGDLDLSFSGDGKLTNNSQLPDARAVAIQSDGKIVVVGPSGGDFVIFRFNTNGTLDTTFSADGKAFADFGGTGEGAKAVAIQSDGKIVVAGETNPSGRLDFALARFNTDGSSDTTFSGDGKLTLDFAGGDDFALDLALRSDGRILVAGTASTTEFDFALAQFTAAGFLDLFFSGDGKVTTDIGGPQDFLQDVAFHPNGFIYAWGDGGGGDACLATYSSVGVFAGSNCVSAPVNISVTSQGMVIETDGRILAVTHDSDAGGRVSVRILRFNPDLSFVSEGVFQRQNSDVLAEDIALQPDGKIVVVGRSGSDFAVIRFNTNLTPDTTFSGDGLVTTNFAGFADEALAVAIQKSNGRIVAVGRSQNNGLGIARYHAFECNGSNVTILGTQSGETLNGSSFGFAEAADVILGLGGNDTINGLGNNDTLCGGDGNDTINGGLGNDTLLGQNGNDSLDGSKNTDTCIGGGQAGDTFTFCETVNTGSSGFSGEWVDVTQMCNRSGQNPQCRVQGIIEVVNPGIESTAVRTQVAFYLSEDEILDENDRFLQYARVSALEPGKRKDVRLNVKLNGEEDLFGMFVIAVLDFFNAVPERNEDNNVVVSPPIE